MSFWAIVILITALSMTWAAVFGARSRSARLYARELAMVDELAHANLPGERHARRWQDVGELLANGFDVYTTLNVANIESLGEIVSRITGVLRAEPVPDAFARAGEITLVDLASASNPDDRFCRIRRGAC